ncbi:MAG: hypothetical protein IJD48_04545, partial [Clostridia bacterium]|nr:hypothetical protein [Clostridia bacterium]
NGLQATSFEQLPQGQHIADVLSICDPDALAWYRDKETGKPLQLDTSTGLVRHINKDKYEKFVEKARPERPNITHDDRFYAISNALYESICTYERGLIDNGCAEQKGAITSMILEEVPALSEGLLYLAEQTTAIYGNGGAISTKADVPIVKTADDTPTEDSAQE